MNGNYYILLEYSGWLITNCALHNVVLSAQSGTAVCNHRKSSHKILKFYKFLMNWIDVPAVLLDHFTMTACWIEGG